MIVLELENINKSFIQGENKIEIINNFNLNIQKGEVVAIVGPSGCGKTSILQIAALLDNPSSGKIIIDGINYTEANDQLKTKARSEKIGFVYQFHNLLTDFNVIENIMMPLLVNNMPKAQAELLATDLAVKLGLESRVNHFPNQLSGGEKQRVAVARALVHNPTIVFADEPTGNLDPKTAEVVFGLIIESIKLHNSAGVIVTHNHEFAKRADRVVSII